MSQRKVMIIGLDALTLDLVRPWVDEGRLPNLSRFMREGAWGPLQSTLPPDSPAAWSTFATGVNSGKHGIINFFQLKPDSYEARFVNAANRHGVTFWEIAGQQGIPGGILNVPITYPPRPYNGFIITGMLSPGVTERMASPPEVFTGLLESSPDYSVDVDLPKTRRGDIRLQLLEGALRCVEARLKAALGLYRKYRPPLFCVVFVAADRVCHYLWSCHERLRQGKLQAETDKQLGRGIQQVYEKLDEAVGALVAEADTDTDFIILSDHGAGPLRKGFDMNEALAQSGFLVKKRHSFWGRFKRKCFWSFAEKAPIVLKNALKAWFPGLSGNAIQHVALGDVDFSRTKAYSLGSECVYVNVKGRQPNGIVSPGDEYEQVRDQIIEMFESLTDPETGRRVFRKAFRREDVWSGPCLDRLPDLIVDQFVRRYQTLACAQAKGREPFYELGRSTPDHLRWEGDHRSEGLLMAMGPHIRRTNLPRAKIADVPATVLALLNCPIPSDFDGRVLVEILAGDVQGIKTVTACALDAPAGEDGLSESDREAVEKRLKGLGYL